VVIILLSRLHERFILNEVSFFLLVFLLATPFWLVGGVTRGQLSADLPVAALAFLVPVIAATILRFRACGRRGVVELLRRSFDYHRIGSPVWFIVIIVLPLAVFATTYGVMAAFHLPLPLRRVSIPAAIAMAVAFLVAGACEELGWTGYALDRMLQRSSARRASLVLGAVTVAFHLVPLLQHGRTAAWIGWWSVSTIAMRVLQVWVYDRTHWSVFAVAVFHAMVNVGEIGPFLDFGPGGYPYSAMRISALTMALLAAVVSIAWNPRAFPQTARDMK